MRRNAPSPAPACPCGLAAPLAACCGRYLDGTTPAPTAEALMRSRYTAFALGREDYLLATWHASTRPVRLGLADDAPAKWIGLTVLDHQVLDERTATVSFVARYKVGGRAQRLHEVSRFVKEDGRWYYVAAIG